MLNLPPTVINQMAPFAPHFQSRTWSKAQVLLVGALRSPQRRLVSQALRAVGLADEPRFSCYHQVLNRARWSPPDLARTLLEQTVATFGSGDQALVFGLDATIERRRGPKIAARGIYHDGVRSSKGHFVKVSGLRWLSLMLLAPIRWAERVWALPIMTVLAPSERYYQQRRRKPRTVLERGQQQLHLLRRWLPDRRLVLVGDRAFAALAFLEAARQRQITVITRLRLDAALFAPPPAPAGRGRPRKVGARLPSPQAVLADPNTSWERQTGVWYDGQERTMELASGTALWYHKGKPAVPIRWLLVRDPTGKYETITLLSTDPDASPAQMVTWFVQRWRLEVTFAEVRRHLGVETQRQWSDKAIGRTTPLLFGLFSFVTLVAHQLSLSPPAQPVRQAAWYRKARPTFADALAWVRRELWCADPIFVPSGGEPDRTKMPKSLFETLISTLCYAA